MIWRWFSQLRTSVPATSNQARIKLCEPMHWTAPRAAASLAACCRMMAQRSCNQSETAHRAATIGVHVSDRGPNATDLDRSGDDGSEARHRPHHRDRHRRDRQAPEYAGRGAGARDPPARLGAGRHGRLESPPARVFRARCSACVPGTITAREAERADGGISVAAGSSRACRPMCGNSICQDRRFLAREMPELERYFHYRNLDVSTLKELARRWNPDAFSGFQEELHPLWRSMTFATPFASWSTIGRTSAAAMKPSARGFERNREPILARAASMAAQAGQRSRDRFRHGPARRLLCRAAPSRHVDRDRSPEEPICPASSNGWTRRRSRICRGPLRLDVMDPHWPVISVDYVFTANTAHIASWTGKVEAMFGRSIGKALIRKGRVLLVRPGESRRQLHERIESAVRRDAASARSGDGDPRRPSLDQAWSPLRYELPRRQLHAGEESICAASGRRAKPSPLCPSGGEEQPRLDDGIGVQAKCSRCLAARASGRGPG